jgi:exonuclease SbcC
MKIISLRFKNLNSLYGEWTIDFTHPEYTGNGIFALTGPTGAGKSTILDAVCLALYGATPRLGKITGSGNEIMSRQTGECYAEVVFESQGSRFRCYWEQHRARKKPDGNLIGASHEISDVQTGRPIETQKSRVNQVIEEKTGMDFDRFTRSILLAQGGFDTFLKADVEQKSRILEQITGTGIYSEISRRVHERHRDEKEKLKLLEAETAGIEVLTPEQETQIHQDLAQKEWQEAEMAARTIELQKAVVWLTGIQGLEKEISELSDEIKRLHADMADFKPLRDRLDRAVTASALEGAFAALSAVRKQKNADLIQLTAREQELPKLEKNFQQKETDLQAAAHNTLQAKKTLKNAAPLIGRIRLMDQALEEKKQGILNDRDRCKADAAAIESDRQRLRQKQEKQVQAAGALKQVKNFFKAHARDEWLVEGFAGIAEQLGFLGSQKKEIDRIAADEKKAGAAVQKAVENLAQGTRCCKDHQQKLTRAAVRLEQEKKKLSELLGDRLLREYRAEKDTLLREMTLLKTIAQLEDYRNRLEDGAPCPLCGAREHPFAKGNVPVPDETEKKIKSLSQRIKKAEEQESLIHKLETAESLARKNLAEKEKQEAALIHEKKAVQKYLSDVTHRLHIAREAFSQLKQKVSVKLHPLGIEKISDSDVPVLLKSLEQRRNHWQEKIRTQAQIEKQVFELDSESKQLAAVIDTRSRALADKQAALASAEKVWEEQVKNRRELFSDKNPEDEENRLNQAVALAEAAEKRSVGQRDDARQKWQAALIHRAALKERIQQSTAELKHLEPEFKRKCLAVGFSSEEQFSGARLPEDEKETLQKKARALDDRHTDLAARQKDREQRLAAEKARQVTDSTMEQLEPRVREHEHALKQLRDTLAGLRHQLKQNQSARERIKEKQTRIKAQKAECHRWEKLHELIGSADGKKYRNFAQGLTFELMVSHANRQLEKMTDRYLLIRDDVQPLELNVVDNYQAGQIRSVRNLSGGESFIVSLTLALGLSRMASRKVRVDSLFLDEGFGTLDEEVLETALETLSGLHQDGKLIGIISHVSALKERISTRISVIPVSGGKSRLRGPGCRKIEA